MSQLTDTGIQETDCEGRKQETDSEGRIPATSELYMSTKTVVYTCM